MYLLFMFSFPYIKAFWQKNVDWYRPHRIFQYRLMPSFLR